MSKLQPDHRYNCHVFVCVNKREGGRPCCGGSGGVELREKLKKAVKAEPWHEQVKVSGSFCLGACLEGPNIVVYPQELWFHKCSEETIGEIIAALKESVEG